MIKINKCRCGGEAKIEYTCGILGTVPSWTVKCCECGNDLIALVSGTSYRAQQRAKRNAIMVWNANMGEE